MVALSIRNLPESHYALLGRAPPQSPSHPLPLEPHPINPPPPPPLDITTLPTHHQHFQWGGYLLCSSFLKIKKAGDDPLDTSFEQDIAPIKEILLALLQEREDFLLSKDGLPNPDTASLDSLRKDTYRESKSEDKNQEEEYAPAAAAPSKAETEMNEQGSTNPLRASLHVS